MSAKGITPRNFQDLTGKRLGRLTVIKRVSPKGKPVKWLCECECGNKTEVFANSLRKGTTKSCGCLHDEVAGLSARTHGQSRTRLYKVWKNMKRRCFDENTTSYSRYGGRGITVCDEWAKDFMSFHDWAFANGYDENAKRGQCTIDRIDNDGNYEPSNCRWVDASTQNKNRRPFKQKPANAKQVVMTDELGNETVFESAAEAARFLGGNPNSVAKCCRGELRSLYGLRWRYANG